MRNAEERRVSASAGTSILRAAGAPERRVRELEESGRSVTVAQAMAVATAVRILAAEGLLPEEIDRLFPALIESDLAIPQRHAETVAALVRRLTELGLGRDTVMSLALHAATVKTVSLTGLAEDIEASVRAVLDDEVSPEAAGELVLRLLDRGTEELRSRAREAVRPAQGPERSEPSPDAAAHGLVTMHKGGRGMTDPKSRNGSGQNETPERERERERLEREREALDREREKMERERERADREREKLDREREKLDRLQEGLEERLERQEERLQELEEELESRMEALDEAAAELEGLEDIEVDGIEGVREMLDVVSDRLPHLMRGLHDSVYSPERLQATAESFASFYKTLTESGMPEHLAAQMTQKHFENLERQVQARMGQQRPSRKGRGGPGPGPDFDPLGPNFDPLGPNFDPLGGGRQGRSACTHEPPEPAEPAEPGAG
jgi:hypothetical protein